MLNIKNNKPFGIDPNLEFDQDGSALKRPENMSNIYGQHRYTSVSPQRFKNAEIIKKPNEIKIWQQPSPQIGAGGGGNKLKN